MERFRKMFEDIMCQPSCETIPVINKIDDGPINFTKSFMQAGRAVQKSIDESSVDQEQLNMGIQVEFEHTDNRDIAKKIALDHLAEISDYYIRLRKMEDEARTKK